MKLPILCMSCNVHILNLDTSLLAWPLRFEMFEFTAPNWVWPAPGPMHTDIFCPICMGFPLHWDANTGKVGKWLNVLDGNGKPKMVSVEQLLKARPLDPRGVKVPEPVNIPNPCPECGAKPGRGGKVLMHKKGCPTKGTVAKAVMSPPENHEKDVVVITDYPLPTGIAAIFEKQLNDVVTQVTGKKPTAETEPISKEDIAELERDRLHRSRPPAQLRALND